MTKNKYFYLVCRKGGLLKNQIPLKIFTNSKEAITYGKQTGNCIIFKQTNDNILKKL